jgi:hypothetical protein
VAAVKRLEIHQTDLNNAFLNDELEETIWLQPPEGYVLGPEGAACCLKESLYGPKHGPLIVLAYQAQVCLQPGRFDAKPCRS